MTFKRPSRFRGDHGAYLAMSMLIAMTFSLLATVSIPDARGLSLAVFDIQGSSTSPAGRVVLGVWGWSAKGAFRLHSDMRSIGSHYHTTFKMIPVAWGQLAGAVQTAPKSLIVAMGVVPIIANVYLFVTFVLGAISSWYYSKDRKTCHAFARAATVCCGFAATFCLASMSLYFATCVKLKDGLNTMHLDDDVKFGFGSVPWLMMSAMLCSLIPLAARFCLRKENAAPPAAWSLPNHDQVLSAPTASAQAPVPTECAKTKEAEAWSEINLAQHGRGVDSTEMQGTPAPAYHDIVGAQEVNNVPTAGASPGHVV